MWVVPSEDDRLFAVGPRQVSRAEIGDIGYKTASIVILLSPMPFAKLLSLWVASNPYPYVHLELQINNCSRQSI